MRKPYNRHNNSHISLEFSKNFKNICQNEETLPQNTKKGKLFPNILFGNNVKYSPLSNCVLQDFKMTQYFGHFKSEFDAVKAKLVYCK